MQIMIAVSAPNKPEREVKISNDVVVGRGKTANLRIISNEVSREHCRLLVSDERIAIHDLGSSNGTQLNGKTIPSKTDVLLASGSHLEVGPLNLVVRFDESLLPQSFADGLKAQNAPKDALDELVESSTESVPAFSADELEEPIFDGLEETDDTEITEPNGAFEIDDLPDTVAIMPVATGDLETVPDDPETETISDPETTIDPPPPEEPAPKLKGLFGLFKRGKKSDDESIPEAETQELESDSSEALEPLPLEPDDTTSQEPLPLEPEVPEPEPVGAELTEEIAAPAEGGFFPPEPEEEWEEDYLEDAESEEEYEEEPQENVEPGFADFLNDMDNS
jgi:pSer/pThr/pTyr-binding forkhead associated (FHA) protein